MKFTYSWLKDYVDIKISPQQLADKLTMAGLEIESLERIDDDWLFQAEVTTNRPDWLSIIGIAREAAAVTGKKFKEPLLCGMWEVGCGTKGTKADIKILDTRACPRYTGRVITGVKVGQSPEWLKKRIESIGLRPINNIVDITNFVLFETGQPLHAFDLDKIVAQKPRSPEAQMKIVPQCPSAPASQIKITVRRARDGEEIVTIDGVKRILNKEILIIASGVDNASGKLGNWETGKPLAIAGIMGGKSTEVTEQTKNILLESAYFDPALIRSASKSLGISSDSSYRFERGVDFSAVASASLRAAGLILKAAGGEAGKMTDTGKKAGAAPKVSVRPARVSDLLGIRAPQKALVKILKSLGLGLSGQAKAKLTFKVPSWRRDLKKEADLTEEIIRIYGYDKIPAVYPKDINVIDRVFIPARLEFEALIRGTLISFGLNETITYSLTDKALDGSFQEGAQAGGIEIKNPLSPELAALRQNLIAGVILAARWNLNRNISDIKLFQIGYVYLLSKDRAPLEEKHLALCVCGSRGDNWQDGAKEADLFYLKGIVESLFLKLGVAQYDIAPSLKSNILQAQQAAVINCGNETVGFLGKVQKDLLAQIDIKRDCFICEINLDKLNPHIRLDKKFSALPKFPAVLRDISTIAREDVPCVQMAGLIKEASEGLVKEVKLFDVYRGKQIPEGSKSLVFRLAYQSVDKTLTDKEVDLVHSRIVSALKEKLDVQIR